MATHSFQHRVMNNILLFLDWMFAPLSYSFDRNCETKVVRPMLKKKIWTTLDRSRSLCGLLTYICFKSDWSACLQSRKRL